MRLPVCTRLDPWTARRAGSASHSEVPLPTRRSRLLAAPAGKRRRRWVCEAGSWKSPAPVRGPVGTHWHSCSLLRPTGMRGVVEGSGNMRTCSFDGPCGLLAHSRPPNPPYQLPPSWGMGVRFKPTRSVTRTLVWRFPFFFPSRPGSWQAHSRVPLFLDLKKHTSFW